MKKGTIIALIVAAVLLVTGGILLILGLSYVADAPKSNMAEKHVTIAEPFDSIVINTADCDVKFVPYNGDVDAEITILVPEAVTHTVVVENGTLTVKTIDERKWHDYIRAFQVYGTSEHMQMTLRIPNIPYTTIRITTDTGDIQIPGVLQAEEMVLRSDTGDVFCEDVTAAILDCMTTTGDITIYGGNTVNTKLRTDTGELDISSVVAEELHLASNTGETNVENTTVQIFTSNGSTGDVELENVQAEEYLQVFTSTGDIEIEKSDAPNVNIKTSTGDIEVPAPWQFQRIETDTGNIRFK